MCIYIDSCVYIVICIVVCVCVCIKPCTGDSAHPCFALEVNRNAFFHYEVKDASFGIETYLLCSYSSHPFPFSQVFLLEMWFNNNGNNHIIFLLWPTSIVSFINIFHNSNPWMVIIKYINKTPHTLRQECVGVFILFRILCWYLRGKRFI